MTKKQTTITIRQYQEKDFSAINAMNQAEGWNNLVDKQEDTKQAWNNSPIAFVAEVNGEIAGCFRGLTDGFITLYVCELLIHKDFRGQGIGRRMLAHAHGLYPKTRLELLASSTSHSYYEAEGFRPFYGFRKTILE